MAKVYERMEEWRREGRKVVAWLVDPDRYRRETAAALSQSGRMPRLVLVGGSLVSTDVGEVVSDIRRMAPEGTSVVLFPGDYGQLTPSADAVLMLSLVSGRNPEYLIGQHVRAAHTIRRMALETIPTAYMLIDGGRRTSVEYVSSTIPLPADKPDLAQATALAAEMMGMRAVYLEAGSGAPRPVRRETIAAVRGAVSVPLIVGGGLRSPEAVNEAFAAGADIAVVGTAIEQTPDMAERFFFF